MDLVLDLDLDLDLTSGPDPGLSLDWSQDRPQESHISDIPVLEGVILASDILRLRRPEIG